MKKLLLLTLTLLCGIATAQNLLQEDVDNWTEGQEYTSGFYPAPVAEQNIRLYAPGPFDESVLAWKATPDDDGDEHGGGFRTKYYTIDHTKDYRFTVWIKKTGTNEGLSYLGAWGPSHVLEIYYGRVDDNPLFLAAELPQLDTWYLAVGFIHHSGYATTVSHGRLYDQQGTELGILRDFKWASWSSRVALRAFSYFDTNPANDLYLYAPRLEEVNENMPDINTLLGLGNETQLVFEYDTAGNQKLRKPANEGALTSSAAAPLSSANTMETVQELELLYAPAAVPDPLSLLEATIAIHPNPTPGQVKITWDEHQSHLIDRVTASDFSGRAIPVDYVSGTVEADIDLGRYPSGIYLVRFLLTDGRQIEKKIIRS